MKSFVITIIDAEEAERTEVNELLLIVAAQEVLSAKIQELGHEVPDQLLNSLTTCKRELELKMSADLERQLKAIQQQRQALATREERRKSLDERETELLAKLGRGAAAAAGGSTS